KENSNQNKLVAKERIANNPYFDLLEKWSDGMLKLQVTQDMGAGIEGGLICPSCSRIHGRCFDAVYPLMTMADLTGKKKYLDAAVKLQNWSKHVVRPDGSWGNDPIITTWNYTTTFSVIALGEAIRYHGHLLDAETLKEWKEQLRTASDWVYNNLAFNNKPVINYPVSAAGALAVAGEVLNDKKYSKRARELAHEAITYFSEENTLLYGEGKPYRGITANGSRPIDVGYNVEESIPNLLLYAEIVHDVEVKEILVKALKSHLHFMIPDGAWDNSWGSRNYKWTYWGSRTSDGCQAGYGILGDEYPEFAEASLRNLELLEACTDNGLLYGGPHYVSRGVLPCNHHTFCHAKALATVLNSGVQVPQKRIKLPRENADGVKEFKEIRTWLAAKGPWRSTFTINDWVTENYYVANASGGALTLLWNEKIGPVLASCLIGVTNREPTNIQMNFDPVQMSPTPMLKMEIDGETYYSVKDFNAQIEYKNTADELFIKVTGKLVSKTQKEPKNSKVSYQFDYHFTKNAVEITLNTSSKGKQLLLEYILPVISKSDEPFTIKANDVEVQKQNGVLSIQANYPPILYKNQKRVFNTEPGFEVIPLVYKLNVNQEFKMKLVVE
ncbi:MAG: hypothetical protein QM485_02895, partial [Flavobacteriaceae bacterium]